MRTIPDIDPDDLARMERIAKAIEPKVVPVPKGGRPSKQAIADREARFLFFMYDEKSPFYGDKLKAGIAAGFPSGKTLRFHVQNCIEKHSGKTFKECAALLGMNKPWLASKLRMIIEDKETEHRTKVVCIKLLMSNLGEKTEDSAPTINNTVNNIRPLVIVATEKVKGKIEHMLHPESVKQIPAEVTNGTPISQ
jgi:hypothetical protein